MGALLRRPDYLWGCLRHLVSRVTGLGLVDSADWETNGLRWGFAAETVTVCGGNLAKSFAFNKLDFGLGLRLRHGARFVAC